MILNEEINDKLIIVIYDLIDMVEGKHYKDFQKDV